MAFLQIYKGDKFTVGPGRTIYRNGQEFIAIERVGETKPVVADEVTHVIAALLTQFARDL